MEKNFSELMDAAALIFRPANNKSNDPNTITYNKFKCPICGEIHDIKDCVLIRQNVDKELVGRESRSEMFRTYHVKHYKVSYYNIRICKACDKSRKMPIKITFGLFICAMVFYTVNLINDPNGGLLNILGLLFAFVFGGCIILGCIFWIIDKCQEIDIEVAKKGNAIDTNLFY
ncbi:MAG: hypothetical protein UH850_03295 [Paludibacteraceae bacterium]|nr:hypothetical protein [Paludibacteraceae bacterium]